ncbi:unnamed protein product [Ostreobium quekettii]|uniref:Centrosomal protein of 44 kDa n=1 Tax=Ostreobium quekettii TaxID=121088 RepID=A0A8S1IUA3_9CHLO|nr:unnamed protein product [Ostreobium quekettii]
MATGDICGNVQRLQRELRQIKFDADVDEVGLRIGDPVAFLPVLHHVLLKFSRALARDVSEHGYEIQGKTDQRFVECAFKVMRDIFGMRLVLTPGQFLEQGYAERKVLLLIELLQVCKRRHNDLVRKQRLTATGRRNRKGASKTTNHAGKKKQKTKFSVDIQPKQHNPETAVLQGAKNAMLEKAFADLLSTSCQTDETVEQQEAVAGMDARLPFSVTHPTSSGISTGSPSKWQDLHSMDVGTSNESTMPLSDPVWNRNAEARPTGAGWPNPHLPTFLAPKATVGHNGAALHADPRSPHPQRLDQVPQLHPQRPDQPPQFHPHPDPHHRAFEWLPRAHGEPALPGPSPAQPPAGSTAQPEASSMDQPNFGGMGQPHSGRLGPVWQWGQETPQEPVWPQWPGQQAPAPLPNQPWLNPGGPAVDRPPGMHEATGEWWGPPQAPPLGTVFPSGDRLGPAWDPFTPRAGMPAPPNPSDVFRQSRRPEAAPPDRGAGPVGAPHSDHAPPVWVGMSHGARDQELGSGDRRPDGNGEGFEGLGSAACGAEASQGAESPWERQGEQREDERREAAGVGGRGGDVEGRLDEMRRQLRAQASELEGVRGELTEARASLASCRMELSTTQAALEEARAQTSKDQEDLRASLTLMDTRVKLLESAASKPQQQAPPQAHSGAPAASLASQPAQGPLRAIQTPPATASPSQQTQPQPREAHSKGNSSSSPHRAAPHNLARSWSGQPGKQRVASGGAAGADKLGGSFARMTLGPGHGDVSSRLFGGLGEGPEEGLPVIGVRNTSELISRLSTRNQEAQQYLRKSRAL